MKNANKTTDNSREKEIQKAKKRVKELIKEYYMLKPMELLWEFLRRNSEYQEAYIKYIENTRLQLK
jgi:hypothetical protein